MPRTERPGRVDDSARHRVDQPRGEGRARCRTEVGHHEVLDVPDAGQAAGAPGMNLDARGSRLDAIDQQRRRALRMRDVGLVLWLL